MISWYILFAGVLGKAHLDRLYVEIHDAGIEFKRRDDGELPVFKGLAQKGWMKKIRKIKRKNLTEGCSDVYKG